MRMVPSFQKNAVAGVSRIIMWKCGLSPRIRNRIPWRGEWERAADSIGHIISAIAGKKPTVPRWESMNGGGGSVRPMIEKCKPASD